MRSDILSLNHRFSAFCKAADLITSPDYVVIKAADEFKDKTSAINEMWQTDLTELKMIGRGWSYLSMIFDDESFDRIKSQQKS